MRPIGIVGVILIVLGIVVFAMRGVSFNRKEEAVRMGPVHVDTEEKHTIPPVTGIVAVVAGLVLVVVGRKRA